MVQANISGMMGGLTKENGTIMTCKVSEYKNGLTLVSTPENIKKIKNMVMEFCTGPMEIFGMKEIGLKIKSTQKVVFIMQTVKNGLKVFDTKKGRDEERHC